MGRLPAAGAGYGRWEYPPLANGPCRKQVQRMPNKQLFQELPQQRQGFLHMRAEGDQGQLHNPAPVPAPHLGRGNPHLIQQHMRESGYRCPTTNRLRKQGLATRLRTPLPPALVKYDRHDGHEVVRRLPVGILPLPDAETVPQHPQPARVGPCCGFSRPWRRGWSRRGPLGWCRRLSIRTTAAELPDRPRGARPRGRHESEWGRACA